MHSDEWCRHFSCSGDQSTLFSSFTLSSPSLPLSCFLLPPHLFSFLPPLPTILQPSPTLFFPNLLSPTSQQAICFNLCVIHNRKHIIERYKFQRHFINRPMTRVSLHYRIEKKTKQMHWFILATANENGIFLLISHGSIPASTKTQKNPHKQKQRHE